MSREQRFFAARVVDVENTSGPVLRHLPESIRALFGYEVAATISFGGLDVIGLTSTPEAAQKEGEELLAWRKQFASFTGFPADHEFIIPVEEF